MDAAEDIKEIEEWKSGPEVDGLNEMCKKINELVKAVNKLNKNKGEIKFIGRNAENSAWVRIESVGLITDEVEVEVNCYCECTSGGGDVGSA